MTEIDGIEIGIGLDLSALDDGLKSLDDRLNSAADIMSGPIGSLALGGWEKALDQLLQRLLAQLLGGIGRSGSSDGGVIMNAVSSLFGGFASGGDVAGGVPILVGERGPEIFMPGGAGRILPHQQTLGAGSGGAVNITVNVAGGGSPDAIRQSAGQVAAAVSRAVARAQRDL